MSAGSRAPLQLAILISGRGSNMAAIARACRAGQLNAQVRVVISDRPGVAGLTTARELGIPAVTVPWRGAGERDEFERAMGETIDAYRPDLVVLAGFMRILSPQFASKYAGRMLNIHPSLLPKYTGLHTHQRALEAMDTEHGASVHFVTAELDGGPIILQSKVPVRPGDTEAELSARVQATEHVIYPRVVGMVADGRVTWDNGRVRLDGKLLDAPLVENFSAPATH
ncbi:MAG TPA: phosphoribosylglycinamide formyltransferase [Steroidobacteraceae bacterium]|nr:phosphoribosylglycinamide formyltransferase [Steroidobacteraceae bacterium]